LLVVATFSERQNGHFGDFGGIASIIAIRLLSASSLSAWPQFAPQRIRKLSQRQRTRIAGLTPVS
jgi:hypothetical protein